jgi:hypothetical protein
MGRGALMGRGVRGVRGTIFHPARMMPGGPAPERVAAMTTSDAARAPGGPRAATGTDFRLNTRPLLVGGVLIAAAGLLGLAGVVVSGSALAAAARDWAARQEVPPSELARQHWERARKATAAGATAWRNGTRQHAKHS